jgi:hypothetical protein
VGKLRIGDSGFDAKVLTGGYDGPLDSERTVSNRSEVSMELGVGGFAAEFGVNTRALANGIRNYVTGIGGVLTSLVTYTVGFDPGTLTPAQQDPASLTFLP